MNKYHFVLAGNNTFKGPIGKIIEQDITPVWKMPVGNYERIYVSNFPVLKGDVFDQLSTDAKHLYRLCLAVVQLLQVIH